MIKLPENKEEVMEELEARVTKLERYIQWFEYALFGDEYTDVHFEEHQRLKDTVSSHKASITSQALGITKLKAQVKSLRQTIIKLHSDGPVHPLIE